MIKDFEFIGFKIENKKQHTGHRNLTMEIILGKWVCGKKFIFGRLSTIRI